MTLKFTAFMEEDKEGWSEVYHLGYDEIAEFAGTGNAEFGTSTAFQRWLIARRGILTRDAVITHLRVSKVDSPGVFATGDLSVSRGRGTFGIAGAGAEIFASLLIDMEAGVNFRRKMYLGGIPEAIVSAPQTYAPNPDWNTAFEIFRTEMQNGKYMVRSRPRLNVLADDPITLFNTNDNGRSATVKPLVNPGGGVKTWYVLLRGIKSPRGWNGVHRAQPDPADPTRLLLGPTRRSMVTRPNWQEGDGGFIRLMIPTYTAVTNVDTVKIVNRQRGRPFGLPRGRR